MRKLLHRFLSWLGWYNIHPQTFDVITGQWNFYSVPEAKRERQIK